MQIKISHVISNNVKKYNFPLRRYQSLNFGSDSFELSSKKKEVNHTPFKKAKIANSAFGADFAFVLKMARLDNEKFSNVEKLVENNVHSMFIKRFAGLEQKEMARALDLVNLGVPHEKIDSFAKLDYENYRKALTFAQMGACEINADTPEFSDEKIKNIKHQLESGIDFYGAQRIARISNPKFYKRALKFIDRGISPEATEHILYNFKGVELDNAVYHLMRGIGIDVIIKHPRVLLKSRNPEFREYLNSGVEPNEASMLVAYSRKSEYEKHLSKGYSNNASACLANTNKSILSEKNMNSLARIYARTKDMPAGELCASKALNDVSCDNYEIDFGKMADFIEKLDIEELEKISNKKYDADELLYFCAYHSQFGKLPLKKEDLIYENLTELLESDFIDPLALRKILAIFPLTDKNVGELPQDWCENSDNPKDLQEKISNAIVDFTKNKNKKEFNKKMSQLLGKEVYLVELQSGSYGRCYAICAKGLQTLCLKIFKDHHNMNRFATHSELIEPQAGLFANKDSNNFVKMFFGRVSTKQDKTAFLVTQFLQKGIKPIETAKSGKNSLVYNDIHNSNSINGKYIDFGGIAVDDFYKWDYKAFFESLAKK